MQQRSQFYIFVDAVYTLTSDSCLRFKEKMGIEDYNVRNRTLTNKMEIQVTNKLRFLSLGFEHGNFNPFFIIQSLSCFLQSSSSSGINFFKRRNNSKDERILDVKETQSPVSSCTLFYAHWLV